jgi:hypothetical protein
MTSLQDWGWTQQAAHHPGRRGRHASPPQAATLLVALEPGGTRPEPRHWLNFLLPADDRVGHPRRGGRKPIPLWERRDA